MNSTLASATRATTSAFIALILLLFPAFASEAFSQRDEERPNIEDLLPETTVAIVQIPDIQSVVDKTMNGTTGKMLEDEAIAPLRERIMEEARKAYSDIEEDAGVSLDELSSIPSGEMVLAMIAPRRSSPVYMVILEVGEENEAAEKAYGAAMDKVDGDEGNESEKVELESGMEVDSVTIDGNSAFIAKREGLIVGCSDKKVLNDFFTRWDGGEVAKVRPLSQNRKFITVMNRCRSKKDLPLDLKFFFDPIAIVKSTNRGNAGAQLLIAMIPSVGLDSILAMGGSMILDDDEYEFVMHQHLLLSNPRKGVTKMISLKPGDYQPERWVPFDALNYLSTSWDAPQMIAELGDLLDLTVEEGTLDNLIANQIDKQLGISFDEDILPNISGRLTTFRVNVDPGKLNSGSNLVGLELTDVEKATEAIEKAINNINGDSDKKAIEKRETDGFAYWVRNEASIEKRRERRRKRFEKITAKLEPAEQDAANQQREMRSESFRQPRGVLGVIGESLVFCDSIEAFEAAVATFQGETPALQNDEEFVEMAGLMTRLLDTESPCGLFFSNPKHQIAPMLEFANSDSSRGFLTSMAESNEFMQIAKGVLDDHELPTMETLEKYMSPQAAFATSDDTGYHLLWFQKRIEFE